MTWAELHPLLREANYGRTIAIRRQALRAALDGINACRGGRTRALRHKSLTAAFVALSGGDLAWYLTRVIEVKRADSAISPDEAVNRLAKITATDQIAHHYSASGSHAAKDMRRATYLRRLFDCYGARQ